jgi:hypothetical protein
LQWTEISLQGGLEMTTKLPPIKTGPEGRFTPPEDGWIHISPFGRYPVRLSDGRSGEILIDAASAAAAAEGDSLTKAHLLRTHNLTPLELW